MAVLYKYLSGREGVGGLARRVGNLTGRVGSFHGCGMCCVMVGGQCGSYRAAAETFEDDGGIIRSLTGKVACCYGEGGDFCIL